jgi:1,4-dihydroxy-2-naphthoate octaprenyltransferase
MAQEKEGFKRRIAEVLAENRVMNVASEGEANPWCATAFFVEDGLDILCLLEATSQTMVNLRHNPRLAFTVGRQEPNRSLQGMGLATIVGPPKEHRELLARMSRKVPDLEGSVETGPGLTIVRIITERLSMSDTTAGTSPPVMLYRRGEEWLTKEEMGPLDRPRAWLLATRPWSFPASIVPMLVGGALAHRAGEFGGGLFVLTLVGGLLFHIGANLFNTYFDFRRGVDSAADADDRTLVDAILRPRDVVIGGLAAFAVGAGIGGFLVSQAGFAILALGVIGLALGVFYTADPLGYKYRALGDLGIFAAFGPILVLGAYMVQTERLDLLPLLFAVPLGLIVDAILHANNVRDAQADRRSGAITLAQLLGEDWSRWVYAALVLAPYGFVAGFGAAVSPWMLLPIVTIPLAWKALQPMRIGKEGLRPAIALLPQQTAQLSMVFGLLLAAGVLASSLTQ